MALNVLSPGEREAAQRSAAPKEPTVEHANADVQQVLDEVARFPFRGIVFEVDPISVPVGLSITRLLERWDAQRGREGEEARREAAGLFQEGIRIIKQVSRPEGFWWWTWRLTRNPFKEASEYEFATILSFLSLCRMRSSVSRSSLELIRPNP